MLNKDKIQKGYLSGMLARKPKPCYPDHQWRRNVAARLRVSLYEPIVSDWLGVYPRDQILFLRLEDYARNPFETLQEQVYPFIGLPPLTGERMYRLKLHLNHHTGSNRSGSKRFKPHQETLDMLHQFYEPYNRRLSDLLGDDKWLWTKT